MQTEPSKLPFIDYHPIEQQECNEAIKVILRFRTNEVKNKDNYFPNLFYKTKSISIKEDGKSVTMRRVESVRKSITLSHRGSIRGLQQDPNILQKTKVFHYDAVTDTDDQKLFFETYAKDNVLAFLKGYNSTILAYGSTGSGKTYTIIGDESIENKILKINSKDQFYEDDKQGIIPRSIQIIQEEMEEGRSRGNKYKLKCSYLEVYNEELTDLLNKTGNSGKRPLIQECPKKGIIIQNMTEESVNSYPDIFKCLQKGVNNRRVSITQDNSRSSRSHTIFMLSLEQYMLDQTQMLSRLCIVDLAGSEKLQTNQKNRMLETKNINTSLLTLAKCINHLSKSSDQKHVPFRESKLTRILKESFGGNSKTTLICTARFSEKYQEETIQTLRFAREAKKIQNQIQVKIVYTEDQLLEQIERLKNENSLLHREVLELKKLLTGSISIDKSMTDTLNSYQSGDGAATIRKSKDHQLLKGEPKTATSSFHRQRSGIQKLSKQSSQVLEDNTVIKQHQELINYKIRFESLKKSSEDQIKQLNLEINNLNEQLSKTNDNKIQEIEQTIQRLASKYYEQEKEIQQEKKIIRDVQKKLTDRSTSPSNKQGQIFKINILEEEDKDSEDKTSCHFIECVNNKIKVQQFENLFVKFEKQYGQLYQENQMSRNILKELSQKLKGGDYNDLENLLESQNQLSDYQDSMYDSNDKDNDDDYNSEVSYDQEKEEKYITNLNKEIEQYEKENKEMHTEIQKLSAKVNQFNVLNLQVPMENKSNIQAKQTMSETFIPINLIDELKIGISDDIKSPLSSIVPHENRGSSRRGLRYKKLTKGMQTQKYLHHHLNGGEKTPQSSFRTWNGQENTPQNRINQSQQSNSSKFSDMLESNLGEIDLSRIENSMYDDYEDESISENLYGGATAQIIQFGDGSDTIIQQESCNKLEEQGSGDKFKLTEHSSMNQSLKKQLFQDEEQEIQNTFSMSDFRQPTQRLSKSQNLLQINQSFNNNNKSVEDSQIIKQSKSDIFSSRKNTFSKSLNKIHLKTKSIEIEAQDKQ